MPSETLRKFQNCISSFSSPKRGKFHIKQNGDAAILYFPRLGQLLQLSNSLAKWNLLWNWSYKESKVSPVTLAAQEAGIRRFEANPRQIMQETYLKNTQCKKRPALQA
jgi:hypothetical protein